MFKMPLWLLQTFGIPAGEPRKKVHLPRTCCLLCSRLSPAGKQARPSPAHTTGNVIQRRHIWDHYSKKKKKKERKEMSRTGDRFVNIVCEGFLVHRGNESIMNKCEDFSKILGLCQILAGTIPKQNDSHINTHEHGHKKHVRSGAATNDHFQRWWMRWLFFLIHRLAGEICGCFPKLEMTSMSCLFTTEKYSFYCHWGGQPRSIEGAGMREFFTFLFLKKWLKLMNL